MLHARTAEQHAVLQVLPADSGCTHRAHSLEPTWSLSVEILKHSDLESSSISVSDQDRRAGMGSCVLTQVWGGGPTSPLPRAAVQHRVVCRHSGLHHQDKKG